MWMSWMSDSRDSGTVRAATVWEALNAAHEAEPGQSF